MISCVVCRHKHSDLVETVDHFKILQCGACGVQFSNPMPYSADKYEQAYANDDSTLGGDFYVPSMRWLREASADMNEAHWFLSSAQLEALTWVIGQKPKIGTLLDCGCGSGWFLAAARSRGVRVLGVEVAGEPVRILQERGFEVLKGSVENVPGDWPQPDLVTVFEVLEHLPNPVEFLASLRARFRRSKLLLSVPSPIRWTKLGQRRDIADLPPNHLTRWNEGSLKRALENAGYTDAVVRFSKASGLEIASASLRALVRCWVDPAGVRKISDAVGYAPLRSLKDEINMRRVKGLLAAPIAGAFSLLGWSGMSMWATAEAGS